MPEAHPNIRLVSRKAKGKDIQVHHYHDMTIRAYRYQSGWRVEWLSPWIPFHWIRSQLKFQSAAAAFWYAEGVIVGLWGMMGPQQRSKHEEDLRGHQEAPTLPDVVQP